MRASRTLVISSSVGDEYVFVDIGGEALGEQVRFTTQQLIEKTPQPGQATKTDIPKALKPQHYYKTIDLFKGRCD